MKNEDHHDRTPQWIFVGLAVAALVFAGAAVLAYRENPLNGVIMVAGLVLFGVPAVSLIIDALRGDST